MNYKAKSILFFQLKNYVESGISYSEILRGLKFSKRLINKLESQSFGDVLGKKLELSQFDVNTINIYSQMGRLDQGLDVLILYYREIFDSISKFMHSCLKPLILSIIAVFLLPLPSVIRGDTSGTVYLLQAFLPFLIIYIFYRNYLSIKLNRGTLTRDFPFLTKYLVVDYFLRWFYFNSLAKFIESGIDLKSSFEISHSFAKTKKLREISRSLRKGIGNKSLGACFDKIEIESEIHTWIVIHERNGDINVGFSKISDWYKEKALESLRKIVNWLPKIIYLIVVLVIIKKILG